MITLTFCFQFCVQFNFLYTFYFFISLIKYCKLLGIPCVSTRSHLSTYLLTLFLHGKKAMLTVFKSDTPWGYQGPDNESCSLLTCGWCCTSVSDSFWQAIILARLPFPVLYNSSRMSIHRFLEAGHGNLMWIDVKSNSPINTLAVNVCETRSSWFTLMNIHNV